MGKLNIVHTLNSALDLFHASSDFARGVPAYTQSTQLRTLIFECPKKIKTSEIAKNAIKHASPGLGL